MSSMFAISVFNGDISKWNVSMVDDMNGMFDDSKFNGDISKWDVSRVIDFSYMFYKSKFNGDLSKWDISDDVENMDKMFDKCPLENHPPKWYWYK